MQQPRWNEGRLDNLNEKVDERFAKIDEGFKSFTPEVKALLWDMNAGFRQLQRSIFGFVAISVAAIVARHL